MQVNSSYSGIHFPFEKFFRDDADTSAVNWKPTGAGSNQSSGTVSVEFYIRAEVDYCTAGIGRKDEE